MAPILDWATHFYGADAPRRGGHAVSGSLLAVCLALTASPAWSGQTFTLRTLTDMALQQHPAMSVLQARNEAAEAAVSSATALINPEIEAGIGPSYYRSGNNATRSNWGLGLSQPLEFAEVRNARRTLAESGVTLAKANTEVARSELRNRVRAAYFDVLHRQALLKLTEEDKALLSEIREKVRLRVELGEAPRYELIKADTEAMTAERELRAAEVRIHEARTLLRGAVGDGIPPDFSVEGELPAGKSMQPLAELAKGIINSPMMQQGRTQRETALAKRTLEERLRNPGLTLKASVEQDPDLTSLRLGVAIPLPVWNQRRGQIAEAAAAIREAEAQLDEKALALQRQLEATYQRYQIARQQVESYESGLLSQARAALKVAEAAYRYGERGILDYLDAQRTYRTVRQDHIAARYELINTALEIERLLGTELLEESL